MLSLDSFPLKKEEEKACDFKTLDLHLPIIGHLIEDVETSLRQDLASIYLAQTKGVLLPHFTNFIFLLVSS